LRGKRDKRSSKDAQVFGLAMDQGDHLVNLPREQKKEQLWNCVPLFKEEGKRARKEKHD